MGGWYLCFLFGLSLISKAKQYTNVGYHQRIVEPAHILNSYWISSGGNIHSFADSSVRYESRGCRGLPRRLRGGQDPREGGPYNETEADPKAPKTIQEQFKDAVRWEQRKERNGSCLRCGSGCHCDERPMTDSHMTRFAGTLIVPSLNRSSPWGPK